MTPDQLAHAACRDAPTALFFPIDPPRGRRAYDAWRTVAAPALELCAVCPVLDACRDDALSAPDASHGIQAGLTPPQIRDLRGMVRAARGPRHGTNSRYSRGCRCDGCRSAHTEYEANGMTTCSCPRDERGRFTGGASGCIHNHISDPPAPPLTKYDAPCCRAKVDQYGRFPLGWCGPDCERRDRTKYGL